MTVVDFLERLETALGSRGVPAEVIRDVLTEAHSHLVDGGEEPIEAFGSPERYAAVLAGALGRAEWARRGPCSGETLLSARGIAKAYRGRSVLGGIDLDLRRGEVVAVVGENGSGKTTLLEICAGLLAADAGEVRVRGRIGYCPQDGGLYDWLTADEHFVLFGRGRSLARSDARAAGRFLVDELGWRSGDRAPARQLSGGARQKLNLALGALGDAEILLLDEPYQGFDHDAYLRLWQQLAEWRDEGRAILVVTHLLGDVDLADRVIELQPTQREVA